MATSFPYLAVAKQYGVDYWRVLQFAELLDEWPPKPSDWHLHPWKIATCLAWVDERNRRSQPPAHQTILWSAISDPTSWAPDPTTGSHKL